MKASTKVGLVLLASYLVAWLDRMAINMAVPFMAKDLGASADKVGWILSAFFAGYALCQIPGGLLADRFGPRKVILFALAWWTVFTVLTGVVTGLTLLLVTRFFFGVGEGLFPASVWKVIGNSEDFVFTVVRVFPGKRGGRATLRSMSHCRNRPA